MPLCMLNKSVAETTNNSDELGSIEMKKQTKSNWQTKLMAAAIATVVFMFAVSSSTIAQETWERGDEWRGQFKIGDKAQFSISGNASDFQTCIVTENHPQNSMRVKCEAFRQWSESTYIVYGKSSIRTVQIAKTVMDKKQTKDEAVPEEVNAKADDQTDAGSCPFNEPAGTVSSSTKASEGLFKRVIFERYKGQESGRKVGITYQTFRLGTSFVNRLTNAGLLNDAAPQNATVYAVKAKFIKCVKYSNAVQRTVMESDYACFKDKFGDWMCGVDSVPKIIEQTEIPNK